MKFVLDQSQFPRVRLSLASCAFVLIVTYPAWHNQQRAWTVLGPMPVTAPELAPEIAADPRPGWVVPQLQPALVPKEEETAAEARPTPEPPEGAKAEVIGSSPMIRELNTRTGSREITPLPLPRPRPRKAPAIGAPNAPSALR
jgi:hypothetical protein